MPTEKQIERSTLKLYKAVDEYVKLRGGKVLVVGGMQVIQFPDQLPLNWSLVVKCTGKMPNYAQEESK